ncbi:MAG: glycosyltransferase family 4 protein [bacterium]|nr:glycosyltransferase family 4 protein [bacterium]
MRVLLVNKFHYHRDGVTTHYFLLDELLRRHGHEVAYFAANHPQTVRNVWQQHFPEYVDLNALYTLSGKLRVFGRMLYNRQARACLRKLLYGFHPDIAHLHNIYYHLTPSIIDALTHAGVPIVMTLHDYQLISPNYTLFLNGTVWERTRPHRYWRCLTERAVKHSYLKSFAAMCESYLQWLTNAYGGVSLFIAPSAFVKEKFLSYGFRGRMTVLPNPLPAALLARPIAPQAKRGSYLLYYGRLAPEKGVDVLVKALASQRGVSLNIAGEGPERATLETLAQRLGVRERISFLGFLSHQALQPIIEASRAVVVPSVWYENFPYAVLESMAYGKLVIASRIGGIPEIITHGATGLLFEPGNVEELSQLIGGIDDETVTHIGGAARERVRDFAPEVFYEKLMALYGSVIQKTPPRQTVTR